MTLAETLNRDPERNQNHKIEANSRNEQINNLFAKHKFIHFLNQTTGDLNRHKHKNNQTPQHYSIFDRYIRNVNICLFEPRIFTGFVGKTVLFFF